MQNVTITTTCCASDQSPMNISCGQSMSCSARCTSLGASLCPTQQCTEDPKDCRPEWPPKEEESTTRSKRRAAVKPSQAYSWCPRYCKWVWYYPACCLHPTCYKKQPRRCNWLYYYLGNMLVSHECLLLFYKLLQVPPALDPAWSLTGSGPVLSNKFLFHRQCCRKFKKQVLLLIRVSICMLTSEEI